MNNAGGRRSRAATRTSRTGAAARGADGTAASVRSAAAVAHRRRRIRRRVWRIRRRTEWWRWRWRRRSRGDSRVDAVMANLTRDRFALAARSFRVLAATLLSGCSYNRFVSQEEAVKAQWAQVQNQLQRRNDLIPNLVETVKGYAAHEQEVFSRSPIRARSSRARRRRPTRSRRPISRARRSRGCSYRRNYPNLKANEQVNVLSDELSGTENRIAGNGCATTSACRSTTPAAASSLASSRRRFSAFRITRCSKRRSRRVKRRR